MEAGADPITARAAARAIADPLDRLEYLMRLPDREVVMDHCRVEGEIMLITRVRGEQRAARTYTGVRLRDAINNLWEHERP